MSDPVPMISVVMPAYNASRYVGQAIESVLQQIFTDFELLIIDDGSTDGTLILTNQYALRDRRIKVLSQTNQGVSATRNRGVQMAKGQFMAFLDADDLWLPDKLAAHIEHFQANPNLAVSFSRVEFISPDGERTGQVSTSRLVNLKPEDFLYENPTTTMSNLIVRSEVFAQIGGFAEDMSYSEDLEWLFRAICHKRQGHPPWQIEGLDRILMYYRASPGGLSASLYRMEAGWDLLIAKAREYAPDLVKQHYALARAVHLRYLARRAFRLDLPPKVGLDFINRAIGSDWRIFLREPRRTLLTLLATYGRYLLSLFKQR
ncbi:MAG: glycosyltransferase [Hydrococcus sp. RU_2_2]|nr:glycosyltransferase [Hydrococcus sp. RU_2_2]